MKFAFSRERKDMKGFTLIELLVVIAIIGILSSVVLASLNTARNKGADTAVKSNLSGARAQAELFYDVNGNSYDGVCGTTAVSGVKTINSAVLAAAQQAVLTQSALMALVLSAPQRVTTLMMVGQRQLQSSPPLVSCSV